ncbi:MAG: hypothetical protein K2K09_01895, partial [Lachnospiraceae bacterium]|nr:hypothetical protein [Lachnospiraceae bacterium]
MMLRKKCIFLVNMLLCIALFCACGKGEENSKDLIADEGVSDIDRQIEKGYDLPIDTREKKEAEDDCQKMMELIRDIYVSADKGDASNVALSDEILSAMQKKLQETKNPVITIGTYTNMQNFESVDNFLKECMRGVSGSVVVYELHSEGGIRRMKFIFDGTNMYELSVDAMWNKEDEPGISYISYTRIKEWKYT